MALDPVLSRTRRANHGFFIERARKSTLVRINESLFFHAVELEQLAQQVTEFITREGEIDAPRFKDLTGLTRKFSIPLLEYFDKIKLTIRVGDKRILRKS